MSSESRLKLDTAIEKELHKLIGRISEHMWDFTHVYLRKNGMEVEKYQLESILNVAKLGIMDGFQRQVNFFHEGIKANLDNLIVEAEIEEEVPFIEKKTKPSSSKPAGRPSKKPSKKEQKKSPPDSGGFVINLP